MILLESSKSLVENATTITEMINSTAQSFKLDYLFNSYNEIMLSITTPVNWFLHAGRALTYLGLSLITIVYKSRLIDPIEEQNARFAETKEEVDYTQTYCDLLLSVKILSGDFDYISMQRHNGRVIELKSIMSQLDSLRGFRPENSNIKQLSDEVQQFLDGPLNESHIIAVINDNVDIEMRETLLQNNITEYFNRMTQYHEHFEDILSPLSHIVNVIRTGVRMAIDGQSCTQLNCSSLLNPLVIKENDIDTLLPIIESKTNSEQTQLLCSFWKRSWKV